MESKVFSYEEVQKHNSEDDLWVVIHGDVYDLTQFAKEHPGGSHVIVKQAGGDATKAFDVVHPKDIIETHLPKGLKIGRIDGSTIPIKNLPIAMSVKRPPLASILNLFDFEAVAKAVLSAEAWAYYSSGGDDELTLQENHAAFHRIWLRPRVLVNVRHIDLHTKMLGQPSALPFYITATALGKLGHPDGETCLTRAAGSRNIIQMIPTLASCSLADIVGAKTPQQIQFFQLYVNSDRAATKRLVERVEKAGVKALFVTVDAPALGRREKDMRVKFVDKPPDVLTDSNKVNRSQGAARAISAFIDPSLSWKDVAWLKSITRLPIVLKGIQTGEDAVLAAKEGVAGIVVSNHGGRQLDTARSGIEILEEVVDALQRHKLKGKLEIFVDGGFRRGSDIFKALAMGAKGVGLGRPFLYAMAGYGVPGVEHAIDLLKEELEMVFRLMGVQSISQIKRESIITKDLSVHQGTMLHDSLTTSLVDPLLLPKI